MTRWIPSFLLSLALSWTGVGCALAADRAAIGAETPLPRLQIGDVEADPAGKVAHVPLRLVDAKGRLQPPTTTVLVSVTTQNGEKSAYQDGQYRRVETVVVFPAGGGAEQTVSVPLTGSGEDGQWFKLYAPNRANPGLSEGGAAGRVTLRRGARAPEIRLAPPPARKPEKGGLVYSLDPKTFRASDKGGAGVARTRFSHGREQRGNREAGYYTDPKLHPGTRSWEARDSLLILRAEKLVKPISSTENGREITYAYSASVLQLDWLSQTYGYYEIEAQSASALGSWGAAWLLPSDGSWPPEIDIFEHWRRKDFNPASTTGANHWGTQSDHRSLGFSQDLSKLWNTPVDLTAGFHTYGLDWRKDFTTWYVDGREVWRTPTRFHKPAFPLLDIAVGGLAGPPDFSKGTTELKIRALRVYH